MVLGRLSVYQNSFACFVGFCTEGAVVKTEADLKDMSGVWEDRTALKCSCSETRFRGVWSQPQDPHGSVTWDA